MGRCPGVGWEERWPGSREKSMGEEIVEEKEGAGDLREGRGWEGRLDEGAGVGFMLLLV